MPNESHLYILNLGVEVWNTWRQKCPREIPDLSHADLTEIELEGANFSSTNLTEADMSLRDIDGVSFRDADLTGADVSGSSFSPGTTFMHALLKGACASEAGLRDVDFTEACLLRADLSGADLENANLGGAYLCEANLAGAKLDAAILTCANLSHADLRQASLEGTCLTGANLCGCKMGDAELGGALLIDTNLKDADLSSCRVYGAAVWDVSTNEGTRQCDLIITPEGHPPLSVDSLEIAQFIYLLLSSKKLRGAIDTITTKMVLILGSFKPERKAVLDAIRDRLRQRNYVPVLFDFQRPYHRDLTETVSTLAHMALFIVADLSEPRCVPHELATIVPTLSVPVQPLICRDVQDAYSMFHDLQKYPWVLPICRYGGVEPLLDDLLEEAICRIEELVLELRKSRRD